MNRAYLDWPALAVIFVVLGWVAYQFSRRTYRLAVIAVTVAVLVAVLGYGLNLRARPATFLGALTGGGNAISRQMFGPLIPASLHRLVVPGLVGWMLLLLLTGGLLVAFDILCTRRQQPTVHIAPMPPADAGDADVRARSRITEELKFRLPAGAIRAPASMPGGSTLQSLAAVVSESGLQGSKLAAAVMQVVHALEARPRTYEVQIFVEHCYPGGRADPQGPNLLVTVDLRDARSGQSLVTRILRPCTEQDAAEMVAGFTARQVFRQDCSTPAWATGSADGDDLSAYLLTREMRPAGWTFGDFWQSRQDQRAKLTEFVRRSTNAGVMQYELASLEDLEGQTAISLLLHLDNRVHHPGFLPARYRLAVTLSSLGGPVFERWPGGGRAHDGQDASDLNGAIIRQLRWAGLLRKISRRDFRRLGLAQHGRGSRAREEQIIALLATRQPAGRTAAQIQQVLQLLAYAELRAFRRRMRATSLLWFALCHRPERAALLDLLRTRPRWWRHPRRRMRAPSIAAKIVKYRLLALREPAATAGHRFRRRREPELKAQRRLRRTQAQVQRWLDLRTALSNGHAWQYGRVHWQAVYNAACLYAQPVPGEEPDPVAASTAVMLLRLAIGDPSCELERPSEWISADPDLRALRKNRIFSDFVAEQAHKDFAPAADNHCPDPWFETLLPRLDPHAMTPTRAELDGHQPVGANWIRRMIQPRSRHPAT